MRRALAAVALAAAVAAALAVPALASERHPTLPELEPQLVCPTCHTTLDQSNSPIAERMRAFIRQRIEAGDTATQIKDRLVAQFGESVLASPPRKGLNLVAWFLPIAGAVVAAAVLGTLALRWSRRDRGPAAAPAGGPARLDPDLERRLDDELRRFDD